MNVLLLYVFPLLLGFLVFMIMQTTDTSFQWYHTTGAAIVTAVVFGVIMFASMNRSDPANQDVSLKDQTQPTDQTQQEILSQLKQINWAIRIGFVYIMLVVSEIIKPGIFG